MVSICSFRNGETGICWPSLDQIAFRARLARSTAWQGVEELIALGHVAAEKAEGRATIYQPVYQYTFAQKTTRPVGGPHPSGGKTGTRPVGGPEQESSNKNNEQEKVYAVATAPASEGKSIYRELSDLFVERSGHKWAAGTKEGVCLAKLVRWAKAEQPARWEEYLRAFLDGAWRLKRGDLVGMNDFDRRRWESVPYSPSSLLYKCSAIVAALETLQADPPDAAAIARSMLAEVGK